MRNDPDNGALLIASGTWLMIAPRADQPLFDVVEYALPGSRAVYMNSRELVEYRDADLYSKRYRDDAKRLNEREVASRWQGRVIDDLEVRRISSFLQSYNEMRKGEEFSNGKFVAAPARTRWIAGPITIVELALMPWRRMRSPATLRRA